ncbi:MAG: hypothetical protein ABIM30_01185 [candidate division WOR-3 bacterium]
MDKKEILKKVLSDLESSGGTNTDHKTVEKGIHEGHTAFGTFGLMLNTAKEMVNRKKIKDKKDLQILDMSSDDEYHKFMSNNPDKYNEYVNRLVDHVWTRSEEDIPIAATMWHYGHNLRKERADKILKKNNKYFERIMEALERHNETSKNTRKKLP